MSRRSTVVDLPESRFGSVYSVRSGGRRRIRSVTLAGVGGNPALLNPVLLFFLRHGHAGHARGTKTSHHKRPHHKWWATKAVVESQGSWPLVYPLLGGRIGSKLRTMKLAQFFSNYFTVRAELRRAAEGLTQEQLDWVSPSYPATIGGLLEIGRASCRERV